MPSSSLNSGVRKQKDPEQTAFIDRRSGYYQFLNWEEFFDFFLKSDRIKPKSDRSKVAACGSFSLLWWNLWPIKWTLLLGAIAIKSRRKIWINGRSIISNSLILSDEIHYRSRDLCPQFREGEVMRSGANASQDHPLPPEFKLVYDKVPGESSTQ